MKGVIIPKEHPFKKLYDPEDFLWDLKLGVEGFTKRTEWTKKGMWAFVSEDWVKPLADWIGKRKVLEVMAGAGWLAYALQQFKIDIIATDDYSWATKHKYDVITAVEQLPAIEAVRTYGAQRDILLISWPYMDDHAYKTIFAMSSMNPDALVVYIGEPEGGCTASKKFFKHFEEIEDEEFDKCVKEFMSWPGLHDRPILGKWKP